jgi:ankyrin repeat protein
VKKKRPASFQFAEKRWGDNWCGHCSVYVVKGKKEMLNKDFVSGAGSGSSDAVIQTLSRSAHVNDSDGSGMTALMEASLHNRLKMVRLLLENGADTDAVDNSLGSNALTFACLSGSFEAVRILLDHGWNVNVQDRLNRTPLMAAAAMGNIGAVLLLMANGADARLESKFGTTAADLAAIEGHTEILALLLPSPASARTLGRLLA